ncbi:hypothetical protein TNCV_3807921 [Trichonephila clavipes]|nr:hypothetical protein TNCV_3807921 [Trichonephila clavipes]
MVEITWLQFSSVMKFFLTGVGGEFTSAFCFSISVRVRFLIRQVLLGKVIIAEDIYVGHCKMQVLWVATTLFKRVLVYPGVLPLRITRSRMALELSIALLSKAPLRYPTTFGTRILKKAHKWIILTIFSVTQIRMHA